MAETESRQESRATVAGVRGRDWPEYGRAIWVSFCGAGFGLMVEGLVPGLIPDQARFFFALAFLAFLGLGLYYGNPLYGRTADVINRFVIVILLLSALSTFTAGLYKYASAPGRAEALAKDVLDWVTEIDSDRQIATPGNEFVFRYEFSLPDPPQGMGAAGINFRQPQIYVWLQKDGLLVMHSAEQYPEYAACLKAAGPDREREMLAELQQMSGLLPVDEQVVWINDRTSVVHATLSALYGPEDALSRTEFARAAVKLARSQRLIAVLGSRQCS